jgi:hypothetical protein
LTPEPHTTTTNRYHGTILDQARQQSFIAGRATAAHAVDVADSWLVESILLTEWPDIAAAFVALAQLSAVFADDRGAGTQAAGATAVHSISVHRMCACGASESLVHHNDVNACATDQIPRHSAARYNNLARVGSIPELLFQQRPKFADRSGDPAACSRHPFVIHTRVCGWHTY